MIKHLLRASFLMLIFISCKKENNEGGKTINQIIEENESRIRIDQGLGGTIYERSGNCMPGDNSSCNDIALKTGVFLCEYFDSDTIMFDSYLDSLPSKVLYETTSDANGFFEIKTDTGLYHLFIKTDVGFYSGDIYYNSSNANKVLDNQVTKVVFEEFNGVY